MKKVWLFVAVMFLMLSTTAHARSLRQGMSGEDVKQWQTFLKGRGFDITPNGKFGAKTHRATIIFQKKWNLVTDGLVGPQTIGKAKRLGFSSTISTSSRSTYKSSSAPPTSSIAGFPYRGRWIDPLRAGVLDLKRDGQASYKRRHVSPNGTWQVKGGQLLYVTRVRQPFRWSYKYIGSDDRYTHKPPGIPRGWVRNDDSNEQNEDLIGYETNLTTYRFTPKDGGAKMLVDATTITYTPKVIYPRNPRIGQRALVGGTNIKRDSYEVGVLTREWAD